MSKGSKPSGRVRWLAAWLTALISTALTAGVSAAAGPRLELRGAIDPAPKQFASVLLHGQDFPFEASTMSDPKGRFRFKNLDPGQYTVIVFIPGRGTVRRSVDLHAARADEKGRVSAVIPYEPTGDAIEAASTVSIGEMTIPKKARREYGRAQKSLGKRDVATAIARLEKAVDLAPNYIAAWNNLGTIAYQSGRYADAEKYFRTALKYEPGAYSPVVNLGGTLLSLNQLEEALKYNEYAVKMRPGEALPNSQLGMNYYYLGDLEKGLQYLNEARRIDPNHFSHPQLTLAKLHIDRRDYRSAIRELEDFLERHPVSRNAEAARRWLEMLRKAPRTPPPGKSKK